MLLIMYDQSKTDIEFFHAGYICTGNGVCRIKNNSRINICECDMISFAVMWKQNPNAVIEIERDPFCGILCWCLRDFSVDRLLNFGCNFLFRSQSMYTCIAVLIPLQNRLTTISAIGLFVIFVFIVKSVIFAKSIKVLIKI